MDIVQMLNDDKILFLKPLARFLRRISIFATAQEPNKLA
jgi:hypothetical protein